MLVVRRLATLVVLGIRLQVDLVPEFGVPIKECMDRRFVSNSFMVMGRHDKCVDSHLAM